MKEAKLASFLKLGYFLDYNSKYNWDLSNINKLKYKGHSENDLIEIGSDIFLSVIEENFGLGKKHVVPISGGIDSRALLAALLKFTEAKNISTYTYGIPNTYDFEIGNMIAKELGTNHTILNLEKYTYSFENLLNISKLIDYQTVLFHHGPVELIAEKFGDAINWIGFMGMISGSHIDNNLLKSKNLGYQKTKFIMKNTYVNSIDLTKDIDYDITKDITFHNYDENEVSIYEQLDLFNRQTKFIAPHVLMKGFNYKTPYTDKKWIDFMLSLEDKYRINQYLYRKILLNLFPSEFLYPTKTNHGLPLKERKSRVNIEKVKIKSNILINKLFKLDNSKGLVFKKTNYINFSEAIRYRKDLNEIVYESINDLEKRKLIPGVDLTELLKLHLNGNRDYSDALVVLTSLEIHLKANNDNIKF